MTDNLNLKPLIDHAIGSLGDLNGQLGMYRRHLSACANKRQWSDQEILALKASLIHIADLCGATLKEWEEKTNVRIP